MVSLIWPLLLRRRGSKGRRRRTIIVKYLASSAFNRAAAARACAVHRPLPDDQARGLKQALASNLISQDEYDQKRQKNVDEF